MSPVIVPSLGAVFLVTTSGSAYVVGYSLASGQVLCGPSQSGAGVQSAPPAWVGGSFGLAFTSTTTSRLYLTGAGGASNSCSIVATLDFTNLNLFAAGAATFSPIVVDAARMGYFAAYDASTGNSSVIAVDLSSSMPRFVWASAAASAAPASMLTGPAIGAQGALLWTRVGASGVFGELYAMSSPAMPIICAPGEYSLPNATCAVCPVGYFSGPVNASAPVQACTPCPGGSSTRTSNSSTALDCVPCAAGFFAAGMGGPCMPCVAGSFGKRANASECTQCPAGSASPALNATNEDTCRACAAGSASSAGAAVCATCQAGTYSRTNASSCTPTAPNCFTAAGAGSACEAALPYAMFGASFDLAGRADYAGPQALPSVGAPFSTRTMAAAATSSRRPT